MNLKRTVWWVLIHVTSTPTDRQTIPITRRRSLLPFPRPESPHAPRKPLPASVPRDQFCLVWILHTGSHTACTLLWLASLLLDCGCSSVSPLWLSLFIVLLSGCATVCLFIPPWWAFGLLPVWAIINKAVRNISVPGFMRLCLHFQRAGV